MAEQKRKPTEKKKCLKCQNYKPLKEYYVSFSDIHADGKIPYCKQCLQEMIIDDKGQINIDKVRDTLRKIDRPFIQTLWDSAVEDEKDTFGTYIKNIQMRQNRDLTWADSDEFKKGYSDSSKVNNDNFKSSEDQNLDELMEKWGYGYSEEEYHLFEKKWNKLIGNYGEKTAFHVEGLITYIRFRVKEELATARGDIKEAKEWAAMAKDAASAAKINVSQLSKSDISGGIELLPQLFEAVEGEVGIIPILPYLKEQPYDDADIIIWCIVNYLRRLEDKPRIEYKEIWNFYDGMLSEYYKQQGYSDEIIEKEKQKRNNVFRDLGKVYKEPLYEEGDS
jgi:hypothetical protein